MANRRMFTLDIVDSDAFLDMPLSTQSLYFHLGMRADDSGFINNSKSIMRNIGASEDELKLLIVKKYIISFDSGVVVIKHWMLHNKLRKDRVRITNYADEMQELFLKENGVYGVLEVPQPNDNQMTTTLQPNVRLGEDRLGEDRLGEDSVTKEKIITKASDDSFRIASYLLNNILKRNPSFKKPNIGTWAKDISKAIEIDKRTVVQLKECIDWIYSDAGAFWQKNILSGKKLREKFDTMNMQVISKVPTKQELKQNSLDVLQIKAMRKDGYSDEQIREAMKL